MAKISFNSEEYTRRLERLFERTDSIIKKALYDGAGIVAEAISDSIKKTPEEAFRYLQEGDSFTATPKGYKKALSEGFGLSGMERDDYGDWNTKTGFSGYLEEYPTKKYPNGPPIAMLARSIEGGSSKRKKYPFVRKSVNASRQKSIQAMSIRFDEEVITALKRQG